MPVITLLEKSMFLLVFLFMFSCDKNIVTTSKQSKEIDTLHIDYVDDPYLFPIIKQLQSN